MLSTARGPPTRFAVNQGGGARRAGLVGQTSLLKQAVHIRYPAFPSAKTLCPPLRMSPRGLVRLILVESSCYLIIIDFMRIKYAFIQFNPQKRNPLPSKHMVSFL